MAAAQVSGAAVLLASARPGPRLGGMRAALLGSARPTSLPVAAGRLDVAGALRRVLGAVRRARAGERLRAQRGHARPAYARTHARHAVVARAAVRAVAADTRRVHSVRGRGTVPDVTWGFLWLMFALKIPIVGLLWIVWWAVHAEPETEQEPKGGDGGTKQPRQPRHPRQPFPRHPRRGPHGDPALPAPRRTRSVVVRAKRTDHA